MTKKTVTIEEVIETIEKALAENEETPSEEQPKKPEDETTLGTPTDQLPPQVAEAEQVLFQNMINNFGRLNGIQPSEDSINCIRYLARTEAVRRHMHRNRALARLDEFLQERQVPNWQLPDWMADDSPDEEPVHEDFIGDWVDEDWIDDWLDEILYYEDSHYEDSEDEESQPENSQYENWVNDNWTIEDWINEDSQDEDSQNPTAT